MVPLPCSKRYAFTLLTYISPRWKNTHHFHIFYPYSFPLFFQLSHHLHSRSVTSPKRRSNHHHSNSNNNNNPGVDGEARSPVLSASGNGTSRQQHSRSAQSNHRRKSHSTSSATATMASKQNTLWICIRLHLQRQRQQHLPPDHVANPWPGTSSSQDAPGEPKESGQSRDVTSSSSNGEHYEAFCTLHVVLHVVTGKEVKAVVVAVVHEIGPSLHEYLYRSLGRWCVCRECQLFLPQHPQENMRKAKKLFSTHERES